MRSACSEVDGSANGKKIRGKKTGGKKADGKWEKTNKYINSNIYLLSLSNYIYYFPSFISCFLYPRIFSPIVINSF